MRKLLALVAVLPALAACSGADALEAEQLLQEASTAQNSVDSESFSAHLTFKAKGQEFGLTMTGGAYLKGSSAGDMVVDMGVSSATPLPFGKIEIAKVGSSAWFSLDGKRMTFPASTLSSSSTSGDSLGAFDFAKYVKDVKVDGGEVLNGKAVTKITGVLDTASLVQGLSALGGAGNAAGLPDLSGNVSDTRAVVYVDDTTHLVVALLADFSVHADGESAEVHLDFAVTGVNEPVALPSA
jgi:hypothetical protein